MKIGGAEFHYRQINATIKESELNKIIADAVAKEAGVDLPDEGVSIRVRKADRQVIWDGSIFEVTIKINNRTEVPA